MPFRKKSLAKTTESQTFLVELYLASAAAKSSLSFEFVHTFIFLRQTKWPVSRIQPLSAWRKVLVQLFSPDQHMQLPERAIRRSLWERQVNSLSFIFPALTWLLVQFFFGGSVLPWQLFPSKLVVLLCLIMILLINALAVPFPTSMKGDYEQYSNHVSNKNWFEHR